MNQIIPIVILCTLFACGESKSDKDRTAYRLKSDSISNDTADVTNAEPIALKKSQKNLGPVYYLNGKLYSTKPIKYSKNYFSDSVILENTARFDKIEYGDGTKYKSGAIYKLKITNKGHLPIPNFEGARNSRLNIIANGDPSAFFMTLANHAIGITAEGRMIINLLEKDSSDVSFDLDFPINEETFKFYGKIITCQWEYTGVKSKILEVDLVKKILKEVSEHRKKIEIN